MKKLIFLLPLLLTAFLFSPASAEKPWDTRLQQKNNEHNANGQNETVQRQKEKKLPSENHDFRKVNWGMTKADVIQAEKGSREKVNLGDLLVYECDLGGITCMLAYKFTHDKLETASYIFTEEHTNENDYIADFSKIKDLLVKKYGTPLKEDDSTGFWKNYRYKDRPQDWGKAISLGHLIFRAKWVNESTEIFHSLIGDNFKIKHGILYQSKGLKKDADERREKVTLDDL